MWFVGRCYKCGHPIAFRSGQKTVTCRRCFKRLSCKKIKILYKVETSMEASAVMRAMKLRKLP
ncbi:hypothetical protein DRN62_01915 [Nanoarchaeota archaeon]|nr:MAG: hypothetical protein DRN62_01915 [Nanoarchaeota archaeon]